MQHSFSLRRNVTPQTVAISTICMLDLLTTLYWVSQGQAREGNPVMAYFLDLSPQVFIAAKVLTFLPALVAAEWYRPRNPALIQRLLTWVIIAYVSIYLAGVGAHYGKALEFYGKALEFYRRLLFG